MIKEYIMNNKKTTRMIVLLLCLAFLLPNAAFAASLGEEIGGYDAEMHSGVSLARGVFWTGSDYRAENYVTCAADSGVYPVAVSRDVLCSSGGVAAAAAELEKQGLHVLAGVNGDYFNLTSLVPVGVVIRGGVLRSSCDGIGAVGFRKDGSVLFGTPGINMQLTVGERSVRIAAFNKPAAAGFSLFTVDFAGTTKCGAGWDVICTAGADFTASCDVELTVEEILQSETSAEIPEGKTVLHLPADADEWLYTFVEDLEAGSTYRVQISCNEGWEEVDSAVGSLYKLVTNGAVEAGLDRTLNPRTAVGVKADGTLVLYTVDGRRSGYSVGATMEQVALRLKELGCVEAGAMDGGGSTVLDAVMPGYSALSQVSTPADGAARPVVNYIFLVTEEEPTSSAERLVLYPLGGLDMLPGASAALTLKAADGNGYAAAVPAYAQFTVSNSLGTVKDGMFYAERAGIGSISASAGTLKSASVRVNVVETPDELTVYGERYGKEVRSLTLEPGQEVDLMATAKKNHVKLLAEDTCFTWSLDASAGIVDETGHLTAADSDGEGILTVSAGGRKSEILITVKKPLPFVDVAEKDWYYDAVKYVFENGLFSGTGNDCFEPKTGMNRAMLATVLWRVSGKPENSGETVFTDVKPGAWYAQAVAWAAQCGVVNGVSADSFAPDSPLTREQIATMLFRYHTLVRGGSAQSGSLSAFPDGNTVSDWAVDSVGWAARTGIVTGRGDGSLQPTESATRAEVAMMLMRYLNL